MRSESVIFYVKFAKLFLYGNGAPLEFRLETGGVFCKSQTMPIPLPEASHISTSPPGPFPSNRWKLENNVGEYVSVWFFSIVWDWSNITFPFLVFIERLELPGESRLKACGRWAMVAPFSVDQADRQVVHGKTACAIWKQFASANRVFRRFPCFIKYFPKKAKGNGFSERRRGQLKLISPQGIFWSSRMRKKIMTESGWFAMSG